MAASPSQAEPTRRAFLVGNQKYTDGYIMPLQRTVNDAKDLGKDLEDAGFDKKNIKVVTDIKSKAAFDKEFDAFLKTVNEGDFVLFYFSGHGFGVEAERKNYLLFTELKSPFTYTRSQMKDDEKRNSDLVRVRVPRYLDGYQRDEIPQSGIATREIEERLNAKNPGNVLMILDACRSLARTEPDQVEQQRVTIKRGNDSGSRLITDQDPPDKFMVLYAAQFGEQAVEGFSNVGRNSLFTEVLRTELPRPGQTIRGLANRVKLMVRAIALDYGAQQEPEFSAPKGAKYPDTVQLIDSIGSERFRMPEGNCENGRADWQQIKYSRKRELLERHLRRFSDCPTANDAQREIVRLSLTSDDPIEQTPCETADADWKKIADTVDDQKALPLLKRHADLYLGCGTADAAKKEIARIERGEKKPEKSAIASTRDSVSECDKLAAADTDFARPPEVPGVSFEKISAPDDAIKACEADVKANPRVARFLFNLGRAYHAQGVTPNIDERIATRSFREALRYYELASNAGYVSALNNLAVLYEAADGVESDDRRAIELFKRGAEQGHPLAMYNLGMHYRNGYGVKRDLVQAAEYFAKAADAGYVSAMVELGLALVRGQGVSNPRRGMEWLITAANQGASRAKFWLGVYYYRGADDWLKGSASVNSVKPDMTLSLLWLGRLAETRDSDALRWLAEIMQDGDGLSSPQPEIAERYWRLAAYGGDAYAQVKFADRLRRGFALSKPQFGSDESIDFLQRAMVQGSASAALALAQIYRDGESTAGAAPGSRTKANARKAMEYAYRAIELAVQNDKAVENNGEPFPEIGAAHLLVELVKDPQHPEYQQLLTPSEIERLEHFYGSTDSEGKVKIRRLDVLLTCHSGRSYDRRKRQYFWLSTWERKRTIWVWDWGRPEAPTEFQFRNLERASPLCADNDVLRRTLIDIFDQSKKSQESFAALVDQKVKTAKGENGPVKVKKERHGRRHRR